MRRAAGSLVPLEVTILGVLLELRRSRVEAAHGYAIAQAIQGQHEDRRLTAYGTLYKALERLERSGLLESRWEEPQAAAADGRPRRRYYRVTLEGASAFNAAVERSADGPGLRAAGRRSESPST